jgi:hypothetical protein
VAGHLTPPRQPCQGLTAGAGLRRGADREDDLMPDDARFAAAARDDGLRRVRKLTFQIGAAALACSAVIAAAFGHLPGASASRQAGSQPGIGSAGSSGAGNNSTGSNSTGSRAGPGGSSQPGSGSVQPPAQNVQPAQGPVQGVSGGS